MSDLHNRLLRRIKEHEQAIGVSLVLGEDLLDNSSLLAAPPTPACAGPPVVPDFDQQHYKEITFKYRDVYLINGVSIQTYYLPSNKPTSPIFMCHHGAGSSAMTFAKLAEQLHQHDIGVFMFDFRGHGHSSNAADASIEACVEDFKGVYDKFMQLHFQESSSNSIYLLGHSLGGAVLTKFMVKYYQIMPNIKGLIMLDIVEETAVKALDSMPKFLERRPTRFDSIQRAIDWHIKELHLLNNEDSAKLSVPDLLIKEDGGGGCYTWRANLMDTQQYWEEWFKGLSDNFVNCKGVAKLLILAGHETLDTNLIIGQMQGKYQLIVFNNNVRTGHFVQEDIPQQIALSLVDFVKRNDCPNDYMKNELGIIPKWGGKVHT